MTPPLRLALPSDIPALSALKKQTFRETFVEDFQVPYPPSDLALYEAANHAPSVLAAQLANPRERTWVATDGERLLGWARVGPCQIDHPDARPEEGELYQLYLARDAQGRGLGKALLDTALDHLAAVHPGPVWLSVWSGNHRAQAIYGARGFVKVGEYGYPVGTWRDLEYILRRP